MPSVYGQSPRDDQRQCPNRSPKQKPSYSDVSNAKYVHDAYSNTCECCHCTATINAKAHAAKHVRTYTHTRACGLASVRALSRGQSPCDDQRQCPNQSPKQTPSSCDAGHHNVMRAMPNVLHNSRCLHTYSYVEHYVSARPSELSCCDTCGRQGACRNTLASARTRACNNGPSPNGVQAHDLASVPKLSYVA